MSVFGYRSELNKSENRMKSFIARGSAFSHNFDIKSVGDHSKINMDNINKIGMNLNFDNLYKVRNSIMTKYNSKLSELRSKDQSILEDSESKSESESSDNQKAINDSTKFQNNFKRLQTVKEEPTRGSEVTNYISTKL